MGCCTRAYRKIPLGSAHRTWEVRLPDVRPAGNFNATSDSHGMRSMCKFSNSTPVSSKWKEYDFCFQWNHFFPPSHPRVSTRNKSRKPFHRTVGIYYNAWINYSIGSVCGINFRWKPISLSPTQICVDKRGNLQVLSRSVAGMVGHSVFACVVGILEVNKNSSGEKKVGKQLMFFDNAEILIFDGTLEFFRGLVLWVYVCILRGLTRAQSMIGRAKRPKTIAPDIAVFVTILCQIAFCKLKISKVCYNAATAFTTQSAGVQKLDANFGWEWGADFVLEFAHGMHDKEQFYFP